MTIKDLIEKCNGDLDTMILFTEEKYGGKGWCNVDIDQQSEGCVCLCREKRPLWQDKE